MHAMSKHNIQFYGSAEANSVEECAKKCYEKVPTNLEKKFLKSKFFAQDFCRFAAYVPGSNTCEFAYFVVGKCEERELVSKYEGPRTLTAIFCIECTFLKLCFKVASPQLTIFRPKCRIFRIYFAN